MITFIQALQSVIDAIYQPINDVINTQIDTSLLIIKMGFGSIEWFSIPFDNLLYIVISIVFYYFVIMAVFGIIFLPYKIIKGAF